MIRLVYQMLKEINLPDKRMNINVDKRSHQQLAIKSIHKAAMTGNNVAKVLKSKLIKLP
jgi:hypothetical protein